MKNEELFEFVVWMYGWFTVMLSRLRRRLGCLPRSGTLKRRFPGRVCDFVDRDVFRGISVETVKRLMASPVVVDRKNLFAGGEGIVYLGIGKGEW